MDRTSVVQFVKRDFGPTWRAVNARRTVDHLRHPVPLGAEGRRVVADLRHDGFALSSVAALTGDDTALVAVRDRVAGLLSERADEVEARREAAALPGVDKPFLVELLGPEPLVRRHDPLTTLAVSDGLRGVADAYYRMQTDLRDLNVWLNLRTDAPPSSSQRWHRDLREDHAVLKCFIFLEEVTAGNGATEYVVGSHRGRAARWDPPSVYDGVGYRVADDEEFERHLPQDKRRLATGPAGTVAFLDTRGYHRGGSARDADRLLVQLLYASGSSIRHRVLRVSGEDAGDPVPRVAALSGQRQQVSTV